MSQNPLSEMTRDELEEEVQILRAVVSRLGGVVTTTDIIRADRDRDDTVLHSRGLEKLSRFKGRLHKSERLSRQQANHRDQDN